MLMVAFGVAGHYMGQSADAAVGPGESYIAIAPSTILLTKGSLLPDDSGFDIVNLNSLRRQEVVAEGKGDYVDSDPGETSEVVAMIVPRQKPKMAVKISPASVDLSGKELKSATKRLALAPSDAKIEKTFKLNPSEKKKVVAQRRVRLAEENCLARAVYFEARSESDLGQMAVAKVILNRVKAPNYPKSICGVVYQGTHRRNSCQFSFACDGLPDDVKQPAAWANAKRIAQKALAGDPMTAKMNNATNYHADYVKPKWAKSLRKLVKIGSHIFYSDT